MAENHPSMNGGRPDAMAMIRPRQEVAEVHASPRPDPVGSPLPQPRAQRARGYGGEAHHRECAVHGEQPPQYLEFPVPTGTRRYRLVRHPRTGLPARDPGGALVFIPVRDGSGAEPPDSR